MVLEVRGKSSLLVLGGLVDVAEAAAGREVDAVRVAGWVVDCGLGLGAENGVSRVDLGRADGGHPRAVVGPGRVEDVLVGADAACVGGHAVGEWICSVVSKLVAG